MKIAYIGIDLFYPALETLKDLGCEILEIFTCRTDNVTEFNTKIITFAESYSIPYTTSRITNRDIERLIKKGCNAAFCGGYYFKIPADTPLPIVNIHPSLLPVGRGPWPMPISILRGDKKSGVTIHKIAEGFDTGDILLQREFLLDADETHQSFMEKANAVLPSMLEKLLKNFDQIYSSAKTQGDGEYWEMPEPQRYTVTSDMTVCEADVILRAFYGYECIYRTNDKESIIIGGRAVRDNHKQDTEFPLVDGYIKTKKVL